MGERGESIALLYHATGPGKTVTAVSNAKKLKELFSWPTLGSLSLK
jgi:type I site-specific restriction-modification system R (restriction) subunit